jgi:hypothetical protein
MWYENPKDNKKYKHLVVNNLKEKGVPVYGETDPVKKTVKVNKKLSKQRPSHKRPITKGANKYPEVADTILHETLHEKNPHWTEKKTYKETHKRIRKLSKKGKQKLYNKFK